MKTTPRILISRTDRMGDVLMSLHAVACVRRNLPDAHIDFLVRKEVIPVLKGVMGEWRVGLREFSGTQELKGYSAALCLYDEPTLLQILKKENVPVRVGNYSKLRSFLFLTKGVRQRRALSQKSEGEYNLELARLFLKELGAKDIYVPHPVLLPVIASAQVEAREALIRAGVQAGEAYWVAHPGMGGSALNLAPEAYVQLLSDLGRKMGGPLILTLGPAVADLRLVEALVEARSDWRVLPRVSLAAVGEVFRGAGLVVAPSTGPLHLAHYNGAQTLGLYSPVRSHKPKRWAPWGGAGKSFVLCPENPCPGKRDCLGRACKFYYCLDGLASAGLPTALRGALTT